MTIPVSRIALVLAVAALVLFATVLVQPAVLQIERRAPLAGRLATVQGLVRDPARLGSWVPWLRIRADAAPADDAKTGVGASFTWGGGQARVEEATPVRTRYFIEQSGKDAEKYYLTLVIDDQGGGITGTLQWSSEPQGPIKKLMRLFSSRDEEIGARLESALPALAKAVREEEEAQRRRTEEERLAAAERARRAAQAAENARNQAAFDASIMIASPGEGESTPDAKPRRLRPSQMPEDESKHSVPTDAPLR